VLLGPGKHGIIPIEEQEYRTLKRTLEVIRSNDQELNAILSDALKKAKLTTIPSKSWPVSLSDDEEGRRKLLLFCFNTALAFLTALKQSLDVPVANGWSTKMIFISRERQVRPN
jgi:hypothetical protein